MLQVRKQISLWRIFIFEKRQTILGDFHKPIWVIEPDDIEFILKAEAELNLLFVEFIEDDAVVDALNWNLFAVLFVVEFLSTLNHFSETNRLDAGQLFGAIKINSSFLSVWLYFKQHDVFRCCISKKQAFEEFKV